MCKTLKFKTTFKIEQGLDRTANPTHLDAILNNKLHGLLTPGGSVSPPYGFASLLFDQGVP